MDVDTRRKTNRTEQKSTGLTKYKPGKDPKKKCTSTPAPHTTPPPAPWDGALIPSFDLVSNK
jgi:hypothetical protein